MKKVLILVMLLAVCAGLRAQVEYGAWTVTPRVGLNWTRLDQDAVWISTNQKLENKTRLGLLVGADVSYRLCGGASLLAGLYYSQQGNRYADLKGEWRNYHQSLDYLTLPVMARLHLSEQVAFSGGVQLGFLLHQGGSAEFSDNGSWRKDNFNTNYRDLSFGIPVGVTWSPGPFELDLRYTFGLSDIMKPKELTYHNRCLSLTVGYRLPLK